MENNNILANVKLHYPSAREWMWDYCVYLGSWTDSETGKNYDLGIWFGDDDNDVAGAIVDGNDPGDYFSPCFRKYSIEKIKRPVYLETLRRARELNLIDYQEEIEMKNEIIRPINILRMVNVHDRVGYEYRVPKWMKTVLYELVKVSKIKIRRECYGNN